MRAKNGTHHFFRSGFTVSACDGDKRDIELLPVVKRKSLQGLQYIRHQQHFTRPGKEGRVIHHRVGCSCVQRLLGILVTIKVGPTQGKKDIPAL